MPEFSAGDLDVTIDGTSEEAIRYLIKHFNRCLERLKIAIWMQQLPSRENYMRIQDGDSVWIASGLRFDED